MTDIVKVLKKQYWKNKLDDVEMSLLAFNLVNDDTYSKKNKNYLLALIHLDWRHELFKEKEAGK